MEKDSVLSDEELNELKELIEKATPGEWWCDSHGSNVVAHTSDDILIVFTPKPYHKEAVRHPETGNLSHWRNDWDASYIPTACPEKIKRLINRLELAEAKLKDHNLM